MLSRVSLGRGNSPPARTSSTYHSGSSRHTVCTSVIIPATCRFFNYFLRFSPVFAHFCTIFCIFGPLAPRRARNPQQEHRTRAPGTTKPPGWGREKPRTGRGARPRTAQRRGGGRPSAPIPGAERRPAPEGGDPPRGGGDRRERAADRRQGSTAARAASGRGGPPQRGDALPAKKGGALRRPAAYRKMPRAAVPHGASGWGLWPPPERGTSRAKRCNAAPRRGGPAPTRPHVAGLHGRSKQRTGPPAPGGRWRDCVEISR